MNVSNRTQSINAISFRAIHEINSEINKNYEIPTLIHTTQFFRYNDVDELIVKKLQQKQFFQRKPLSIVSAGCSYGEEVYSYAIALDNPKHTPKILGIDMSEMAIKEAKRGQYVLDIKERELLQRNFSLPRTEALTEYEKKNRSCFNKNFRCINSKNGVYEKKLNRFANCSFVQGNILDIDNLCKNNSQDIILCRNVLYHLDNADIESFAKKAYKILKAGGMICIAPNEYAKFQSFFTKEGFKQPFKEAPCIFKKTHKFLKFI